MYDLIVTERTTCPFRSLIDGWLLEEQLELYEEVQRELSAYCLVPGRWEVLTAVPHIGCDNIQYVHYASELQLVFGKGSSAMC